jgi:hypothetical protein
VRRYPSAICPSSRNDPSDWSTSPDDILPAQVEQDPARHEKGSSTPAFSAASRMYVSSGASNSCSAPSGPTSFTLYTAAAAANLLDSRRPGAPVACLAKEAVLDAGAVVWKLAQDLGTDSLGAVVADILLIGPGGLVADN